MFPHIRSAILRQPFDKLVRQSDAQFSRFFPAHCSLFPNKMKSRAISIYLFLFFGKCYGSVDTVLRNVLYSDVHFSPSSFVGCQWFMEIQIMQLQINGILGIRDMNLFSVLTNATRFSAHFFL